MFLPVIVFYVIFDLYSFRGVSALLYTGRIVGGTPTTIEQYPYQVYIVGFRLGDRSYTCGGSIISETWILTAAHCVSRAISITGLYGSTYNNKEGVYFVAKSFFAHEMYNRGRTDFDIGLIQLQNPIYLLTPQVKKIKLAGPWDREPNESDNAIVTGWGTTSEDGHESRVLRVTKVPIISNARCQQSVPNLLINEHNICAGLTQGGKDACQGDSGGPLVIGDIQVGIVSWGVGCARKGVPGVYTKVAAFYDWINSKLAVSGEGVNRIN